MAGTAKSPNFSAWTPTLWLGGVGNFSVSGSNDRACENREPGVSGRKKNTESDRSYCRTPQARRGWRPHARSEMDTQDDPENCPTTPATRYPHQREHCGTIVERHGILLARQS